MKLFITYKKVSPHEANKSNLSVCVMAFDIRSAHIATRCIVFWLTFDLVTWSIRLSNFRWFLSFKTRLECVYVIFWESPSFPCPRWPHFSIFKKLTCTYVVSHRTLISGFMTRNCAVAWTWPASWTFSPRDQGWLWSSAIGVCTRHGTGEVERKY